MLRRPLFFLAVALSLSVLESRPNPVEAQCAFDAPTKAKGIKSNLVRAYAPCPGITFLAPNTSTTTDVPACAPPMAISSYQFGPKGSCSVKIEQRLEAPCLGICGFDCANFYFDVKCTDVRDDLGDPVQGPGWALSMVARVTFDDATAGDMTFLDSPLQLGFSAADDGKLKLKTDLYSGFIDPCFLAFAPPCATIAFRSIGIVDPDGRLFATLGSSSR